MLCKRLTKKLATVTWLVNVTDEATQGKAVQQYWQGEVLLSTAPRLNGTGFSGAQGHVSLCGV